MGIRSDDRFKHYDRTVCSSLRGVSLNLLMPVNLEDEKKKFFSSLKDGAKYNPLFIYPKCSIDFDKRIKDLEVLKFKETILDDIFKKKTSENILRLKMYKNRGKETFTNFSIEVYGVPSKELLSISRSLIKKHDKKLAKTKHTVSPYEAAKRFRKELDNLRFQWVVEVKEIVAKAQIVPSRRVMVLKKSSRLSKKQINRFIAHEIYTHIVRAECGKLQPYNIFSIGTAGYTSTEEGLALYKEGIMGTLDVKSLKEYAGRVLAVHFSLKYSFRKTFILLTKHFSKNKAWELTLRAKRGIGDTSLPGSFTKDLSYLKGYYEIVEFVKNPSCMHLLHYGKIGIRDTENILKINQLKNPNALLNRKYSNVHYNKLLW